MIGLMKLWIGGEVEAELADVFRMARNSVEKKINNIIERQRYEVPFKSWDCIAIIRNDEDFAEVHKFSRKKRDMDFRLKIDFRLFKEGDESTREQLLFQMLLRSLALLSEKGVHEPDLDRLRKCVMEIAAGGL